MTSGPHILRLVTNQQSHAVGLLRSSAYEPGAPGELAAVGVASGASGTGRAAQAPENDAGPRGDAGAGAQDPSQGVFLSEAQLFKRFAPYVARIGLRLLGRESDVDDLIQEVFLAAFRQRDQLRDPNAAKNWLATIAVRTARRQLRRRRLRQFVGLDQGGPALELPDPGISPEKRALLARVYEILDGMGVDRRLAWTLRFVEGEKLEVVAERCGCSLATVKRRIASAQALLLAEMDDG